MWIRCELGTFTEQYGVYTDRQGSNMDVAWKPTEWTRTTRIRTEATGLLQSFYGRARYLLGYTRSVEKRWPKQLKKKNDEHIWEFAKCAPACWHHENNLKHLLLDALFLQQQHEIKDGEKKWEKLKNSHGNVYIWSEVISWRQKFSHPEDAGHNTELSVATWRLPDIPGGPKITEQSIF